jgi:hypothetical protein
LQLHRFLSLLLISLTPWLTDTPAVAQGPDDSNVERGSELTAYLMTMGPGSAVWERFGHNAIWIRDELRGTDVAYNYGMFSFEQENFFLRFIRGHMDYWMEGYDAERTALAYIQADRSVWAQELNLTPAQRADLRDFLEWNARPENRMYRYDYYLDNCSTRVRDAIDRVLGGQIRAQTEDTPSGTTYRDHTRRLTRDDTVIYTALMLGLGQPVDREISVWEEMFLPLQLIERVREVTVLDDAGERVPLVGDEFQLYQSSVAVDEGIPPFRTAGYLLTGVVLGLLIWGSAVLSGKGRSASIVFGLTVGVWTGLAGLLGLVLMLLWAATDHQAAYWNENLFFYSPVLLPLAALLPFMGPLGGESERRTRLVVGLALAVAALSILGLVLQTLPAFRQVNGELIALALPVNFGVLLGALEVAGVRPWRRISTPSSRRTR